MRFHIGISFRPKQIAKWVLLIIGGLLAFFGISHVKALTTYSVDNARIGSPYTESYYRCNDDDSCTFISDNTVGSSGSIPWTSGEIGGQDYSSVYDYTVGAIRRFSLMFYNSSSVNTTIPANSTVTIKLQFTNLDKFTKGKNFNNPFLAVRTTSNTWLYGSFDQSFVCNKNSCTLTYKTPNQVTKGCYFFWGSSNDMSEFFVRNDTSIDYTLGVSSYTLWYDNATADTVNSINNQTQVISSWSSTINDNITQVKEVMKRVVSSQNTTNDLITDSSIDDNSSFFTNFNDNNHGLSGIVSAPLVLIRGLNSGETCTPLSFTVLGANVSMPSGCILWDNVPSSVETVYFVFIGGFLAYILVTKLFHDVNDLKDPEKGEVSTLDL